MDSTLIAAIITAVATILAVLYGHWLQSRKTKRKNISVDKENFETKIESDEGVKYYPQINNGGIFISRFIVNAYLGRGGYSDVYLATDKTSHNMQKIILKLFRYEGQPKYISNYIDQETLFANRFKGQFPGIIKYREVTWLPEKKGVFILQDYIQSNSLHDILLNSLYSEKDAVNIAIRLCESLCNVHDSKIVHCDIKPKNILLPTTSPKAPIIIDFGVSRFFGSHMEIDESFITLPYSAPELLKGSQLDGRTDIFSLAVTIMHMLFGLSDWESRNIQHYDYSTLIVPSYNKTEIEETTSHLNQLTNLISNESLKKQLNKALSIDMRYRHPNILQFKEELLKVSKQLK